MVILLFDSPRVNILTYILTWLFKLGTVLGCRYAGKTVKNSFRVLAGKALRHIVLKIGHLTKT